MAIATLSIDIEARLARLEEGLDRAARINKKAAEDVESRWQAAGNTVKGALAPLAAAFSVAAIQQFIVSNAKAVDALNDVADATGSTVENISALQDVALRTGTSVETVETALIKLNQALSAAKPDSDAARALKAIGLSAKELKELDPAEALRRVAVALGGFADDGNKARLVQELFGKSLREVAPLLKDLSEQTKLVGSVTKEQKEQAERFAHALGQWDQAAMRTRQAFVNELLPTLTEIVKSMASAKDGTEGVAGAAQAALVPIQALAVLGANVAFVFRGIGTEIGGMAAQLAALGRGDFQGFKAIGKAMKEDAEAARKALDEFEQRALGAGKTLTTAVPEALRDTRAIPQLSVGDIGVDEKAKKEKRGVAADLDFRRSEIASTEKTNNELRLAQLDAFLKDRQARIDAEILQNKQVLDNIDAVREAEEERERVAANLNKKRLEEMSEFAKQAQRNIQDTLASSVENALSGRFDRILEDWNRLLARMVSQAIAANIGEALFGKDFKGGAFGPLLQKFLSSFGGPRADGGPVWPGKDYIVGERGIELFRPSVPGTIVPNGAGGGGGGTTIINNVAAGVTRAELTAVLGQLSDAMSSRLNQRLARAGV